jgi:hypothetical protein
MWVEIKTCSEIFAVIARIPSGVYATSWSQQAQLCEDGQ